MLPLKIICKKLNLLSGGRSKKMSTLQSCESHLFATIIILLHGTDLWGHELKLKQLEFS